MHENTVFFYQFNQATISTSLIVPVLKNAGDVQPVSDSRSLMPPCHHTASGPHSPHHQNITN